LAGRNGRSIEQPQHRMAPITPSDCCVSENTLIKKLFMGGAHPAKPALGWHRRVVYGNTNKFCVCEWKDSAYHEWQAVHV